MVTLAFPISLRIPSETPVSGFFLASPLAGQTIARHWSLGVGAVGSKDGTACKLFFEQCPVRFSNLGDFLNSHNVIGLTVHGCTEVSPSYYDVLGAFQTHNQLVLIQLRNRPSGPDLRVHKGLSERRLIQFVMSPTWVRFQPEYDINLGPTNQRRYTIKSTMTSFLKWLLYANAASIAWATSKAQI
jgi:hypothetical protein